MVEEVKEQELDNAEVVTYVTKYLETFNKTEAYLAVHPDSTKISAMSNTFRYWNNSKVQNAIRVILDDALIGTDELKVILTSMARGEKGVNKANQLKAIELLMKAKGMFTERLDITTQGNAVSWQAILKGEDEKQPASFTVLNK